MKTTEEKLLYIDEVLARLEDYIHGKDGKDITKARILITQVISELK